MSQQADTSCGRQVKKEGRGGRGGRGYGGGGYRGQTTFVSKAFKSPIVDIASDTFNIGQIKFAEEFTQSRKTILVISNADLERSMSGSSNNQDSSPTNDQSSPSYPIEQPRG